MVFEGRHFIFEPGDLPSITVILEQDGELIFEILRNMPMDNPISSVSINPTGTITVSNKNSGDFIYKIRPDSETSVLFGTIEGEEISVKVTDSLIKIGTSEVKNCAFNGVGAGVVINKNGGFALGAGVPRSIISFLFAASQNLKLFVEETFEDQRIELDGGAWFNCTFKRCDIVVATGEFVLNGDSFDNSRLSIVGRAQNIVGIIELFFPGCIPHAD